MVVQSRLTWLALWVNALHDETMVVDTVLVVVMEEDSVVETAVSNFKL